MIMAGFKNFFTFMVLHLLMAMAMATAIDSAWYDAHATFYGDLNGSETLRKSAYIFVPFLYMIHIVYIRLCRH